MSRPQPPFDLTPGSDYRKWVDELVADETARCEDALRGIEAAGLVVHLCDFAQQPDIRIACQQRYSTPAWGKDASMTDYHGVFREQDGELYTFDKRTVTCPACAGRLLLSKRS